MLRVADIPGYMLSETATSNQLQVLLWLASPAVTRYFTIQPRRSYGTVGLSAASQRIGYFLVVPSSSLPHLIVTFCIPLLNT